MKREAHPRGRALPLSLDRRLGLAALLSVAALASHAGDTVVPQVATTAPATIRTAATATPREQGVRWLSLTPALRESLAPLERDWPSIDAPRKQKWLELAARFKTLTPEERGRITARMAEWAKLTPAERGQARLRFEETRQLPAPDRSERWKAYQALPPEQKQQLAARAASAASAPGDAGSRPAKSTRDSKEAKANVVPSPALTQPPRQVAPTLVQAAPGATTTPITRRPAPPAHQQTGMPKIAATPEFVNRSTLLPRRGPQAAAVASAVAVAPATPVAAAGRTSTAPASTAASR